MQQEKEYELRGLYLCNYSAPVSYTHLTLPTIA